VTSKVVIDKSQNTSNDLTIMIDWQCKNFLYSLTV